MHLLREAKESPLEYVSPNKLLHIALFQPLLWGRGGERGEFNFWICKFEMLNRHPSGNVGEAVDTQIWSPGF